MRISILPGFVNQSEIFEMNSWVEQGVANKWLDFGSVYLKNNKTDKRLTTRACGDRFDYPDIVYDVFNRIKKNYSLEDLTVPPNQGKDGIVVSYIKTQGDVFPHKDPKANGLSTLRCNIVTQESEEGGDLFVGSKHVPLSPGDLHCYLASEYEHHVTTVKGCTPRILWMFGFLINKERWE